MIKSRFIHILYLLFITALLFPGTAPANATPADDLAQYLCATSGVSRGICALPRAGDGTLALSLAHAGLLVHAMDIQPANVAQLRDHAFEAGILGSTLYAEEGSPAAIPFADSYVNLLVVSDATDANLSALPAAEMQRVLIYGIGKAIVGLPVGAPGKLSTAKLTMWSKGFTGASSQIIHDTHGLWVVITRNPQPGAVAWTHRLFSPANNVVSPDTACAWPLMTQWLGRPYLLPEPLILVANGRMAIVRLTYWGDTAWLEMRDAHNGLLLWRRNQPDASVTTRTSAMALFADTLYLAEGPNVLILDPASGKEIGRVDCHTLGGQVKWLAVEDGALYVMGGSAERKVNSHQTWVAWGDMPANFGKAGAVGVYTLATKQWAWQQQEPEDSLYDAKVGLYQGRLYYYVVGKHLTCRDGKTGKAIWENPAAVEQINKFKTGEMGVISRGHVGALICTDKYVAILQPYTGTMIASAATGDILWSPPPVTCFLFYKDVFMRKGGPGDWPSFMYMSADTGKILPNVWPKLNEGGGCGTFTMTPNLLCGQCGVTYDLKTGIPIDTGGAGPVSHKTPCLASSFVGEGLNVNGSVTCKCLYGVRGTVVLADAPSTPPVGTVVPDQLHRVLPASQVAPFPLSADDWPTFRANNARGNASSAHLPEKMAIAWTWPPLPATPAISVAASAPAISTAPDPTDADKQPVQVSAAGGLVFVPGNDGLVTALEIATGAVKWHFATGGRLFAPPTIANDRCFIGSGDGVVYCLEATGGRELWHYRVAPADRRIMVYGDLLSTWPISGGVLVDNGVVYAIAGLLDPDSTYVVALDVLTGAVKWRNDTSGHLDTQRNTGIAGMGYPAIARGRLWIRGASYELATGVCHPTLNPKALGFSQALFLRYTGYFADAFLVTGGARFFDELNITSSENENDVISFVEMNDDITGKTPVAVPWFDCRVMPAWDARNLLAMPAAKSAKAQPPGAIRREEDLLCWDTPRAVTELRKDIAAGAADHLALSNWGEVPKNRTLIDHSKNESYQEPQKVWLNQSGWYLAAVLTADAAVAVHALPVASGRPEEMTTYFATAYDRTTGAQLWQLALPGQPQMDGVSIARDGSVLVRMVDGRVVCLRKSER